MSVDVKAPAATSAAASRNTELVWADPPKPVNIGSRGAIIYLLAAGLIAAVGMLYLLQTNHVANLGYEMSELQAEREAALVEQQTLSAQIAEKQSLTTIELIARRDLGMRPLGEHIFLDVVLPAPASEQMPDEDPARRSLTERFWDRITGKATRDD